MKSSTVVSRCSGEIDAECQVVGTANDRFDARSDSGVGDGDRGFVCNNLKDIDDGLFVVLIGDTKRKRS